MNAKQHGMTLLEIMVAVTIMVIMAALSIPSLTRFGENLSLLSSTRKVSNMIRLAQRYAINYNSIYRIDIDPIQNWAAIYWNDTGGTLIGKVYRPSSLIHIATTTINGTAPSELVAKASVMLYPKGSADPSAYIHFVRSNSVFNGVKDSLDVTLPNPIGYYQSSFKYDAVSDDEKQQCYTLQIYANTGRVKLHKTGVGGPWE